MNSTVTLKCSPLRFYSNNDEKLLFTWLKKIKSIVRIEGIGRELHLIFASNYISNKDLRELMGLFDRYKFNGAQLKVFMNESNKDWFEDIQGDNDAS
jgi:hypothetical protein